MSTACGAQPWPTTAVTFASFSRVDQNQRFTAEAVEILLDDAAREERRNAGVERVAAFDEDRRTPRQS